MDYALFSAWKPDEKPSRAKPFDNAGYRPVDGPPSHGVALFYLY